MAFNPQTRKVLIIFLILGWLAVFTHKYYAAHNLKKSRSVYSSQSIIMGTFWEVISDDQNAARIVFQEANRLDRLLSKYNPKSEIAILNRLGKLKVSPETFYIIKKSLEFWKLSDGAFDISVAPLIDLWGFSSQKTRIPGEEEIKATLKLVGSNKIILQENNSVIEFKLPGMKIDLGGIAKGFALDCAVKKLKENGINNCLINAGGQVYALGKRSGRPWKVAIKEPNAQEVRQILFLEDQSSSTSGNYEQYFLVNHKRYCHIINPKTGYPVETKINSVTVVNNLGIFSDALSTTIFILGKESFEKLNREFPGTKIYIREDK